ncbi:MAG: site-specific DNA-methyltransferase, partial [Fuerstiella sp.]
ESDWYFPRVAGTFKERAGFHGCQMPEQLLGRIIRTCSEENEIVLDPFSGSASTLVVAKKLKRQVVGFELSEEYAKAGTVRLAKAAPGDELTGAAEPTMSAPKTWQKRSTGHAKSKRVKSSNIASEPLSEQISTLVDQGILSAYTDCRSTSLAELVQDEAVTNRFVTACGKLGIPGSADFLIRRLQEVIDRLPAEQQNFEFAEN